MAAFSPGDLLRSKQSDGQDEDRGYIFQHVPPGPGSPGGSSYYVHVGGVVSDRSGPIACFSGRKIPVREGGHAGSSTYLDTEQRTAKREMLQR
mmetsp:Transcript_21429/g.47855  ORF Transcript_21429/g.47855 Transcript_21429/m.47855 type:complete len:93 (-) Transcript_21429:141-419(-)